MKFRTYRENSDGSITVEPSTAKLSVEEFARLQALMPEARWFGIVFPRPEDILNPSYVPTEEHAEFLKNYAANPGKFLKASYSGDNQEKIIDE
jgi:hypothetical protein